MIEVKCDFCKKIFKIKAHEIKRRTHHFCSRVCWGNWKGLEQKKEKNKSWAGGKIKVTCVTCKKEFELFPNYAKKRNHLFCSQKCYRIWRTEEMKKYISICCICGKEKQSKPSRLKNGIDKTCSKKCEAILKSQLRKGAENPNWKDGITPLCVSIRACNQMNEWKYKVFKKDQHTDRYTGDKRNLVAHHIIPFSKIIEQNNISTLEEAFACELLWDVNNGLTLHETTHNKYHAKWGNTEFSEEKIKKALEL